MAPLANIIATDVPLPYEPQTSAYAAARKRIGAGLIVYLAGLLALTLFITFSNASFLPPKIPKMALFATASSVILVGMAGLYFYAFKFYRDVFYAFLAAGWIGNALYITIEGFYQAAASNLIFSVTIYLFAQISFIPFYFASSIGPEQSISLKRTSLELLAWFCWIFLALYSGMLLLQRYQPHSSEEIRFLIATLGGIPFSVLTLIWVGRATAIRLNKEVHGQWAVLFPLTFYIFAAIQPLYALKLFPRTWLAIKVGFGLGLLAKILNSICAIVTIHLDFGELREKLERVTILQDLGILTASIEHEIKNPLQVIANDLAEMSDKFQSNKELLRDLNEIEQQRQRIYAATEIIKNLRAGPEFYAEHMTKTSIRDLVFRSVKAVKGEMKPYNILFKIDGDLVYTKAYQPVLQQVFVNILKNAVEAIREANRDKGIIRITIKSRSNQDGMCVISISDNGCGIPAANMPRLGQLFSTKRKMKPNSGIGLFISKRILNFHGGKLSIQSDETVGTTVSISLPAWREIRN